MARVNTNTKKPQKNKKNTKETKRSNVVVQEESPKGEAFFRVVLWLMFAALLAAATWLIVQTIMTKNNEEKKPFESEMYITLDELKVLDTDDQFRVAEGLSANLKKALSQSKNLDVYIYFYDSSLKDGKEVYQTESNEHIKNLWKNVKKETTKDAKDKETNFYYFDQGFAVFFFDFAGQDYSLTNFKATNSNSNYPYLGQILKGQDERTSLRGNGAVSKLNDLVKLTENK